MGGAFLIGAKPMATTRMIPMHINKGKTIAQCMKARLDYVKNPNKTEDGDLITAYACSPETADHEFLLSRNAYLANTGRHISHEIIAYQLRQSFKPGEVTPEEANRIGYELAMKLTGGEFAFLVATHNDKRHVHSHLVINAVSIDCTRKYRNQIRSIEEIAAISDELCRAHGLSVVEHPQNKTVTYDKWQGDKAKTTSRDSLRIIIDAALRMQPDGFDALMQLMEEAGCLIKRGAQISIKPPNGLRYIRLDTLGNAYSEQALRAALAGDCVHVPRIPRGRYTGNQVELLVNIEQKLRAGKGYQRWAERHNTNAVAKSMIYLKEHHIDSYEMLEEMIRTKTVSRNKLRDEIRQAQSRMKEISEQKKAITTYRRTKAVYQQYRESGWSSAFYQEHAKEIDAHQWAQEVYRKAGGKLPTLSALSAEYDQLLSQKREDSTRFQSLKREVSDLYHIKTNLDIITEDERPTQVRERTEERKTR